MIGGKNDFRSLKEKYTLFTWSQPVGYDFSEVEKVIDEYRETISDMNELLIKKEEENDLLRAKLDDYTKEIVEMRMNMEAMTIPVYPQQQAIEILDNFKDSETVVVDTQPQQEQYHQPAQQQRQQPVNTKKQDLINRQQQSSNQHQYNNNQMNVGYGQPQQNQQQRVDRRVDQDTRKRLIVDDGDDFYTSSAGISDIII